MGGSFNVEAKTGKPILGAVLGGSAALVLVLILWIGAIVAPTQLVVWGLLGLGILVGSLMLTTVMKSAKFISVMVLAALMIVWAGVGAPAHNANGDLTGGCTVAGISTDGLGLPLDAATPKTTSASNPMMIDRGGAIEWEGSTPGPFEDWTGWIAVEFAGFNLQVWSKGESNEGRSPNDGGIIDVAVESETIYDYTRVDVSGLIHMTGNITSSDGTCDLDAWLVLEPESLFSGWILITLWGIFGSLVITLIIRMIPVCRIRKLGNAEVAAVAAAAAAGGKAATAGSNKGSEDAADGKSAAPSKQAAKKPAAKKPPAKK